MKKVFFLMMFAFTFGMSNAQVFDGVEITGQMSVAIEKFKAKGYRLIETYPTGAKMLGKVGIYDIELFLTKTPKTGKLAKIGIYFDEEITWYNLLGEYKRVRGIIVDKYGSPTSEYSTFLSPYEAGDGYEMTAVKVEKCIYASYWILETMNIGVEIKKYGQVMLTYENSANMELLKAERAEKERNTF